VISTLSPNSTRHFVRLSVATIFLASALSLSISAAPALAAAPTPCWQQVMNQWYQGEIKSIFPLDCYQQAIKHLPTDIQVYSSARDDINRALQAAIAYDNKKKAQAQPQTTTSSAATTPTTTTKAIAVPVIHTHGPGSAPPASAPTILNSASPGGATSFPLPLLILGGLAIVLVAAGGIGLLIRRRQSGPGPA
jgi:hypothetical protein